jgi:hypothetical protein
VGRWHLGVERAVEHDKPIDLGAEFGSRFRVAAVNFLKKDDMRLVVV